VTLRIFDASGVLMVQITGLSSDHLIQSATLSPLNFDPLIQVLKIRSGDWNFSYAGKDAQGNILADGSYILEIDSVQGSNSSIYRTSFTVLTGPSLQLSALAAPNPVAAGSSSMVFSWNPPQSVDLEIYDSSGGLIQNFVVGAQSSMKWDLKTKSGHTVAAGVYLLILRVPGQRSPKIFKCAVTH
jgi:hypothetical protein